MSSPEQELAAKGIVTETYRTGLRGGSGGADGVPPAGIGRDDFYAYMLEHKYIFAPTGEVWPASSVDARLPTIDGIKASCWLDRNRPVEQMTWAPGLPTEIRGKLIAQGGWLERNGCSVFNLYRPPASKRVSGNVKPWLDHLERLYGEDAAHILKWCAHRVQRPQEKINHALVLGGGQGIGKDTLLEPVKQAVGAWNFAEVSPQQVLGRFNGFLKSVILRVSEARDLGDFDRFVFYDHMKSITAAPPDVLRIDEKNRQEYCIPNVCGVIITSNHKTDGIHLPADDRRHFVAWSGLEKKDFPAEYWNTLWHWYLNGGFSFVAHHLQNLDLAGFDPKAPPPQTDAFFEIVNSSRSPEDAELADALDRIAGMSVVNHWPDAVTLEDVAQATNQASFAEYLRERRNSRRIPHRFEACGYSQIRNPDAEDGLWRVNGRRQVIYGRRQLSFSERLAAARKR
ncbi:MULTISPECIES: primase-helicase family protein [Bradyrhizobium]|uniref:primase-helicase family protein n=1 Tax=Bradyrhizobium TaxID=374 RepID=UPI001EDC608D|nr:primase-helicase family protein [Bradyrhizobium zhengyangense]MCG2644292.1 DUF5906 domain-containing protein [Bradyrhizobium zhengyangense]